MRTYLDLLEHILETGTIKKDRTGVGTISTFGYQSRYDLRLGLPVVTTKKIHLKSVIAELIWIIQGHTNVRWLQKRKVRIWNDWCDENGDLGPVYGHQLRAFASGDAFPVDQLQRIITQIRENPTSRRHVITLWNPCDLDKMALPPCHGIVIQFNVCDGYLDLLMHQRSADAFLGVPFNITSYSILLSMVAQVTGYTPRYFVHSIGDLHIYTNHMKQVQEQLTRDPMPLPSLCLDPTVKEIDDFSISSVKIENYKSHPRIKGVVAV